MSIIAFADIETLDTRGTSVVLSFGMTYLMHPGERLTYIELLNRGVNIKLKRSEQGHRTASVSTLEWWQEQSKDARTVLTPSNCDASCWDFTQHLHDSIAVSPEELHDADWYCRGPAFDFAIMNDFLDGFGQAPPWHYRHCLDMRTLANEHPNVVENMERPDDMIPHNALHDAAFEGYLFQEIQKGRRS